MLAHHPETGQPIRILRSDAQITQSRRTLVWLQAGYEGSTRWQRWNIVISDPALWHPSVTGIIIHEFKDEWISVLRQAETKSMVFLRNSMIENQLKEYGLSVNNYIRYDELFQMYPFLGEPVSAEDPIEKVVVSLAHILRFPHLVWTPALNENALKPQLHAWKLMCGGITHEIPANSTADVVPSCWLIQQYFKHSNGRRAKEINECLERNIANSYIDKILLLNEEEYTLPESDKIIQKRIGARLTYKDVMEAIRNDLPVGAFAIFSNSDIWCDESLQVLWSLPMEERRLFLALLRWEQNGNIFGPRPDSQDTWIVAKSTVDFEPTEEDFGFPFGKPGCDNAISMSMLRKRCLVLNPAYSLKTHHIHASNIRDYNPRDVLYRPMYLYMDPTHIQMFAIEVHMKAWESKNAAWRTLQPQQSFSRIVRCVNDKHMATILRAIEDREGEHFQGGDASNLWTPSPQAWPMYEMKNTFVSDSGLLSNFSAIFVGQHEAWKRGWQSSQISSVSTTIHVPALIAWGVSEDCWGSLASWCLHYLPMILRIRKAFGSEYEFLVPTLPEVPPFLYDCVWRDNHVGTVPHIPNTQYFCNRVLAPAPLETRVTKEDVAILRELLPPCDKKGAIVVCLEEGEEAIFTEGWFEEWRTCHQIFLQRSRLLTVTPSDSPKKRREAFQQADWILGRREALQWIWMARPETRVVEWMLETEISSEIAHLAGASQVKYIASLVRKEPVEYQREHAILEFAKIWAEYAFIENTATIQGRPRVFLPAGKALSGHWVHAHDGFREMVRVWGERGFCEVVETEDTPYVWWGDIGETLLYDYDTERWWNPTTSYQLALFGRCIPPGPSGHESRQSEWSFWGRAPRMLEAVVTEGRLNWSERVIQSLFLGKVENGVQKAGRCGADWKSAVELFSMPQDSTGAPYPYTQSEYLQKLRQARFGLCLPGFGNKCNREIEYFALGVVPIATPDVDFTHYLVAPQEGVHYFRATTPADVKRIIAETTAEKWESMSCAGHAWWRQNASAEGLFRLTWGRIEQCRPLQGLMIPPWKG